MSKDELVELTFRRLQQAGLIDRDMGLHEGQSSTEVERPKPKVPQALKAATDEEICAEIQRMRGAAVEIAKGVGQIREQVVKMYESVGLKLGPKKPPGV